ncbi:MAG: AbrB family transcriptional regulator [Clostridiales bacterium]|jgi:AbrB family looped-hinge helix DNA binding protein|nr:AbrB family transcriptional regulator [Clostridiales bacterium]
MKNMIGMNLKNLRKMNQMTQEEVAAKINVSRQAVAKWENGESDPDIYNCSKLAELFQVTIDDLINYSVEDTGFSVPTRGKYFFGPVTVGERGQIVIPKKAREVFNINQGDQLLLLGDIERGIAIIHQRDLINFIGAMGLNATDFKKGEKNETNKGE